MQRYHFHPGVATEKLLLLCSIVSSLIVMTTADTVKPHSNDFIFEQVKNDTANYKIVSHDQHPLQLNGLASDISDFVGKITEIFNPKITEPSSSSSLSNVEHFTLHTIVGDGRCMFRALVKGMAANKGVQLGPREEEVEADVLKMEIKKVICDNDNEHSEFEEAIVAIIIEEGSLKRYCKRIMETTFWGGEAELAILSKLLSLPIIVYKPQREHMYKVDPSAGFIEIAKYRPGFKNGSTRGEPKNVVRLSFTATYPSHYDLLL